MRRTFAAVVLLIAFCTVQGFAADSAIRLNTIGFLPDMQKHASIAAACSQFKVVRSADSSTAFSGAVSGPKRNSDTQEDLYTADFSSLAEEGTFYLSVDGVGRSPDFAIKKDVYNKAYYTATRAMYLWRCGCAVSGTFGGVTYAHAACHTNDAWLDYISGHVKKQSLKGWHDAGDFNKYTVNAGITVGMLLDAWQQFGPRIGTMRLDIPESGGALPDLLAEVKWELDWLLTMQLDDGSVSHKVSTTAFCGFIMPETEATNRYFVPWGSAATADFVAMMAMASRVYKPYDTLFSSQCLSAAIKSYTFLTANPNDHQADQTGFSTGGYTTTDPDDRLWAAAELWETTGGQTYLADFESRANNQTTKVDVDWDWGNVKNLGMFTYILSKRQGKNSTLDGAIKNRLLQAADSVVLARNDHGYGRPMGATYYWGCNGSAARQTMLLQIANSLSPKTDYLNTALDAIGHLFGRNYFCRSFVTGMGLNPPLHPHDRRSIADGITNPWPGYLVGGGWPGAKNWVDVDTNYQTNEIAINWQGALIYALAMFVNPQSDEIRSSLSSSRQSWRATSAAPRIFCGRATMPVRAGRSVLYDCKGKLLKEFDAAHDRLVDLRDLGLRQGAYIIQENH